jgi:hypothetical protein
LAPQNSLPDVAKLPVLPVSSGVVPDGLSVAYSLDRTGPGREPRSQDGHLIGPKPVPAERGVIDLIETLASLGKFPRRQTRI